jgi:hypothetical protein
LIALFWIQAAQLILDVESRLAAQVEQILALQVQFARQCVDANLLFLHRQLLYSHHSWPLPQQ